MSIAVLLYFNIPEPTPSLPRVPPSDAQLRAALATLTTTARPETNQHEQLLAGFGRKLFHDPRFSANGEVSCATCHHSDRAFTDGKTAAVGVGTTDKNAPTIINAFLMHWFFWDGRADSLAAQALGPLENPLEHGLSRTEVAFLLRDHHKEEYTALFGKFPEALDQNVPMHAVPPAQQFTLSLDTAAYSLATLGSFSVLNNILGSSRSSGLAPARELSRVAFEPSPSKDGWQEAYTSMSEAQQKAVNQVFANFGRAVAAFERGIVALDSPFDRFAARVLAGGKPEEALEEKHFGMAELQGLRLFVTAQCALCHTGPLLSDQQFHNIGLPQLGNKLDLGRAVGAHKVAASSFNCLGEYLKAADHQVSESCRELPFLTTDNFELVGAFKTPTLRNVALTAPYMHDGRFKSLQEVLKHYNTLSDEPAVGHREESLKPLNLTPTELANLEAFLRSLTSPVIDIHTGDSFEPSSH